MSVAAQQTRSKMAGLYIHVPFCHSKCWYCDFYSLAGTGRARDFVDALGREWELRRHELAGQNPGTIYFGGGTPSILSDANVKQIAEWLPRTEDLEEVTIEVNPEDVTAEKIGLWKEYLGVNRVSMGVQSLKDSELQSVGRRHTVAEAFKAIETIRSGGITNLSLDLIYGLPGQTVETWRESLSGVLSLRPAHLSAYILSYEPGTRLYTRLQLGKVKETDEDVILEMYRILCEETRRAGYSHYEISNFALPGLESKHNSSYWDDTPYLGLGPGAHSFDGDTRRANPVNLKEWLDRLNRGYSPATVEEEIAADKINDLIMVSLRRAKGLDLNKIPERFRPTLTSRAKTFTSDRLILEPEQMRLFIPEEGWPVSDGTIAGLFVD